MRKSALISAAALLLLIIFWAGLALNFPGEAVSRAVEARMNRLPNLRVRLSPAGLSLLGVHVDEFKLNFSESGRTVPVLALNNVRIPFTGALFGGLTVKAEIGDEGAFDLFIPWNEGELTISGAKLRMEDIPGFTTLAPAKLRGGLSFDGKFQLAPQTASRRVSNLPEGRVTAQAEAVELTNLRVMGTSLPMTRLDSAQLALKTGKRIEVEQINLRGDVQGGVKGFIQPRLSAFTSSPLQLNVTVSFRQSWLQKLGAIRPLVESFLKNGRLEAVVRGSLGKPTLRPVRGAG